MQKKLQIVLSATKRSIINIIFGTAIRWIDCWCWG